MTDICKDGLRFLGGDFLRDVDEAFLGDGDGGRQQSADEGGLAEAVGADEGDAVGGPQLEVGEIECPSAAERE